MPKPREPKIKSIPLDIHLQRETHHQMFNRTAHHDGMNIRKVQAIERICKQHRENPDKGMAATRAKRIERVASLIADELRNRRWESIGGSGKEKAQGLKKSMGEWNDTYVGVMKMFWPQIPEAIREEILKQSPKE